MDSADNFTTNTLETLYIDKVTEAYQSTNTVNSIREILKHNNSCTGLDYMPEILSPLALQAY